MPQCHSSIQKMAKTIFDLESLAVYRAEGNPGKKNFIIDNRLRNIKFR